MKKKTVLIIGSKSDIAITTIKVLKEKFNLIKLSSKELDLSKIPISGSISDQFDHIIFFSAINKKKRFIDYTNEEIIDHYNINFLNFSLLLKEVLPIFKNKRGINKIILISSLYSTYGRANRLPYSTSKFALKGLGKNLAVEYGKFGIITNLVTPGFVNTKLTKKNISAADLKKIRSKTPINALITKKQIAEVINFLLSDKSNGINGHEIIVDGGLSSNGNFS